MMNSPAKYVVSKTLDKPIWRNTTIIRDNLVEAIRKLKAAPGKSILTDGSHQLVHTLLEHDLVDELHLLLYPLILGSGKRLLPERVHRAFQLKSATPYPSGVVGLHYERARCARQPSDAMGRLPDRSVNPPGSAPGCCPRCP